MFRNLYERNREYFAPVFAIALPTIADMFVQTLLGFSDMVMVGRIGPTAINAVGVGNAPILLITTIFFALATGTTAIMSRAYGAGSKVEGKKVASQTIYISVPIAILVTVLMIVFGSQILEIIGDKANLAESQVYYTPVALGVPFLALNIIFAALYRAVGYAKVPMTTNIVSVVTNIILNAIFIFGFKWGVFGAGLATTLARVLVCGIYTYLIFIKKSFWVTLSKKLFRFNKGIALRILNVGIPSALEQGLFRVGMLIFEMLVIRLGTISYASHKIALTAESFSFNLGFGFAVASTSLVGQQLGKGNAREAEKYANICTILAMIVMTIFGFSFLFFPHLIIKMFTSDQEIQPLATSALRIISLCQLFLAATMVLSGSLRGAGSTKSVLWSTATGMYFIRVPLTYILIYKFGFGLTAAWVVMSIDLIYRSLVNFYIFRSGRWRTVKV